MKILKKKGFPKNYTEFSENCFGTIEKCWDFERSYGILGKFIEILGKCYRNSKKNLRKCFKGNYIRSLEKIY